MVRLDLAEVAHVEISFRAGFDAMAAHENVGDLGYCRLHVGLVDRLHIDLVDVAGQMRL
jgi:hypothetical protein